MNWKRSSFWCESCAKRGSQEAKVNSTGHTYARKEFMRQKFRPDCVCVCCWKSAAKRTGKRARERAGVRSSGLGCDCTKLYVCALHTVQSWTKCFKKKNSFVPKGVMHSTRRVGEEAQTLNNKPNWSFSWQKTGNSARSQSADLMPSFVCVSGSR